MKTLFLIPTPISEDTSGIPKQAIDVINNNTQFICERVRTSRRFIKSILKNYNIDASTFVELDKRGEVAESIDIIFMLKSGNDICFMSEAGSPCIADPGSELVTMARTYGYHIAPISGPSAIMMALMASGMTGQQFTFRGYLPVKKDSLKKELKQIEKIILQTGCTQIFIETPYRNAQLYSHIVEAISATLRLHISFNINGSDQFLQTMAISKWKKDKNVEKRMKRKAPCIFILGI